MRKLALRALYLAADPALRLDQQGGAGTHMRGTIAGLRTAGVEVRAAVGSVGGGAPPTLAQCPVGRARHVVPPPVRRLGRDLMLLTHGRSFQPELALGCDVVYERSAYLLDVGLRVARTVGVPYVLESDGFLVSARRKAYGAPLARFAERVEQRKHHSADLVTVMSRVAQAEVASRYEMPLEQIIVKGLGVEQTLLERPISPLPDALVVGFAGTFQPYHGVELLVEAAERLDEARLLLIGAGPEFERVRARAGGRAEMPGLLSRDETLARLSASRVLAIPASAADMYPVKLLEYVALGRPIVCPAHAVYDEFARRGSSPLFLFEPGSADDLARALRDAAGAEVGARVRELRELVLREYTWEAVGRRLAGALDSLVRGSSV